MRSARKMPLEEIAVTHAQNVVAVADRMNGILRKEFEETESGTVPDLGGTKWRYEFCIFEMFWFWWVAISPKFSEAGWTKPLVDAYQRACYEAFRRAGLIGETKEALREWEDDVEAKFLAYKEAYECELAEKIKEPQLHGLNVSGRGSVGRLLVHHVIRDGTPHWRLILLLNELGRNHLHGLVEMFNTLETDYCSPKSRWKFWK